VLHAVRDLQTILAEALDDERKAEATHAAIIERFCEVRPSSISSMARHGIPGRWSGLEWRSNFGSDALLVTTCSRSADDAGLEEIEVSSPVRLAFARRSQRLPRPKLAPRRWAGAMSATDGQGAPPIPCG
jgi:hypothetical protein